VNWEEEINGIQHPLPFATVSFFLGGSTGNGPSRTYELNEFGRASGTISVSDDEFPVEARLLFTNSFFTLQSRRDNPYMSAWELPLQVVSSSRSRFTIDAKVPQSLGPDLGRVWTGFQTIRSNGDALVGLWDVPHIDVLFPGEGSVSYYTPNFINLLGARSRLPEVYAHEYGHHVMQSLMAGGIPPHSNDGHEFCSTTASPELSWIEGYATAFGLKVLGLTKYRGKELEKLSCPDNRDMRTDEARVAAGMLDLMDVEGAVPECAGTDETLGRPGFRDRTTGNLFTPSIVLRDFLVGPQTTSIREWWGKLEVVGVVVHIFLAYISIIIMIARVQKQL